MRVFASLFFLAVVATIMRPALGARDADAACRPYFGPACSDAIGRWLPNFAHARRSPETPTVVVDEIVDPAGRGEVRFLSQRGVIGGTFFVHGTAGPPRGHAVYDPLHKIAFYDEGCCSWHHVVVAAHVPSPPKTIVARSLVEIRTKRGIRLGDPPAAIIAVYGPARRGADLRSAHTTMLSFRRVEPNPSASLPCEASMTFLFVNNRLTAMDFTDAC